MRDAPADRVTAAPPAVPARRRIVAEIVIVLGLSLGMSALYSIVTLINRATYETPLADQTATIVASRDSRPIFDLLYQLLGIASDLFPVALVCFLLWSATKPHLGRLGIDAKHPVRDTLFGLGLALPIGIAGLGIFLAGRALGIGVGISASNLTEQWWTIPVLLLTAARAAIQEEVIMIGYLFARLGDLRFGRWAIILTSAAIRGTYHLYQGYGAFVANFAMGVVFGWLYTRGAERRVIPFVVTHFAIDAVVLVGAPAAANAWPELFAPPT
ncbi:CPBP family intramembrane glutamic endopeptidase [Pseudolysinimonas yzui]|uniref:CAAX amino protease n=1 Tax=Pseudolysinimonas yzui TaxID=2708254 RepID=A0A8J3GQV1_9MICO|nr:CPBP family intramembrane glutamic endopeptidase [Pseudolysinimonas yzui]GHF18145.1 CAAX amino protease [Pseudolysinimonas yzui]